MSGVLNSHPPQFSKSYFYYRHTLPIRLMHWVNVVCFIVLLMSGLNIFNAHPALNLGKSSYNGNAPIMEMKAVIKNGELRGRTNILGVEFDTTGLFGVSNNANQRAVQRGFPTWMTLPSSQWLSMARHWHFFFAWLFVINGICYITYSLVIKHIQQDMMPRKTEWAGVWQSIKDHARFKHDAGEAAKRFNILQKLAYISVIFILLPLVILMGWAMSPFLNSLLPGWIDLVGGRQSARTIHFIVAWLLVGFVFIHVFQVLITGVWNNMRSMMTGNFKIVVAPAKENKDGTV